MFGSKASPQSRLDGIAVTQAREGTMILGLRTVVYEVDDLEAAKRWYTHTSTQIHTQTQTHPITHIHGHPGTHH